MEDVLEKWNNLHQTVMSREVKQDERLFRVCAQKSW